jgi:hypothetical protein
MQQAREELGLFRENMAGLAKQMDGIALDLVRRILLLKKREI